MGIWFVTKPRALNGTNRRGSLLAADLVDTSCRSFFLGGGESSRMAELGTTMSLAVEGFSDFFEGHKSVYGTALSTYSRLSRVQIFDRTRDHSTGPIVPATLVTVVDTSFINSKLF